MSALCLKSITYPHARDHCLRRIVSTLAARLHSAVSHFQRLTHNYEFRDYVNIFILKCRLCWTFQPLSNFGPCIKLSTSTEKFSYRRVINWIKSKLIKASYVKRRRRPVRSSMVQILQNRQTDYFFTPAVEPQWNCISYIRIIDICITWSQWGKEHPTYNNTKEG
jgi:hypothetical protein